MSYRAYVEGYSRSAIGGRVKLPGLLHRLLTRVFHRRAWVVARALGIQDAIQDRALRTRAEVDAEVERLLA